MQFQMTRRGMAAILISAISAVTLAGCGAKQDVPPGAPTITATAAPAAGYVREANATLEALAAGASGVAEVMAKADPAAASWRSTLGVRLDVLAQVNARAQALRPAPGDAEVHQRLLEITADFGRAAQLIRTGIDPINIDNLDQAAQILGAGVTKVAVLRAVLPAQ